MQNGNHEPSANLTDIYFPGKIISDAYLSDLLSDSLRTIEDALSKYRPSGVILAFNGGKDCTLLLHLYHLVLQRLFPEAKPSILFIEQEDCFEQLMDFVELCKSHYSIGHFLSYKSSIQDALISMQSQHPQLEAILMGTRRDDPHGSGLQTYAPTDASYGNFVRVNALLKWSYTDVWKGIKVLRIPYCSLYDQGYTSLGLKSKTKKNPALYSHREGDVEVYKPAFHLTQDQFERSGRL